MPRPNRIAEQRRRLIPIAARTFSELGYRRTTTAVLARRCGVRENILYRLWRDKKAVFIDCIDHVYQSSASAWDRLLGGKGPGRGATARLLEYESEHHGEMGLYRIVFAGLSETDDPEIRKALRHMYGRFHRFITHQITNHRKAHGRKDRPAPDLAAWAVVGLGTVANIGRELGLLGRNRRKRLMACVGRALLRGIW